MTGALDSGRRLVAVEDNQYLKDRVQRVAIGHLESEDRPLKHPCGVPPGSVFYVQSCCKKAAAAPKARKAFELR